MKGHMDALARMIKKGRSCTCLLDQSSAIQSSLKSLDVLIIKDYLSKNLGRELKNGKEEAIKKLLGVYKREQRRQFV